jgi:REP element-mobilizing transposase RayT
MHTSVVSRTVTTHTGGGHDHVHLFVKPDQTASPAHIANQFKGFTSRHPRAEFPGSRSKSPMRFRSYAAAEVLVAGLTGY